MGVKNRLARLERKTKSDYSEIRKLIAEGVFYDQLTPDLQLKYKEYRESWGAAAKDIALAELSMLMDEDAAFHFQLQPRRKPPTAEELAKTVAEIEEWFKECQKEYNSAPAVAEREAQYRELRRIGQLREAEFKKYIAERELPLEGSNQE